MTLELEELTGKIISCAIEVHKKLGPGFLESIYQVALPMELVKQKLKVGLLFNFARAVLKIKRVVN